ncbi:heme b synthase [Desulfomonile tiedjei]|uniref:Putative heme d1 biosynthesis radical SAM protein NirJ2 n=1 Tax=Desulfomonile tiedjei (strain ATCC 49306 / DSM 6799 / DCB-1) TaxID=706587 RepID=I4C7T4_DESTA|nr:heme b synthase [Desulfomonile tiedjei]AFM25625.1 putative heme d1 biosynthesis radical SAM protein NirJ2 [Desulfomonile tiedjei DSM 6799]
MNRFELRLVAWEMTRACNLACVHCRAGACADPDPEQLSFDEGRALIDGIAQVGKPILIMTGGEPLIRPDFFDLARYAIKAGLRAVLATNGVLVTPEVARDIAAVGIPRVSISIDGPTAESHDAFRKVPGAFDASLKGIANLKSAGVGVQINTTITRRNRDRLADIMNMAESIGAEAFHVFLLVPTGRAKDMAGEEMGPEEYEETLVEFYNLSRSSRLETKATCAPQYYRILRQQAKAEGIEVSDQTFGLNARTRGCLGGLSFVFVSHKGELQPCGYFDVQAGSIRKSSFKDLWENAEIFKNLRKFSLLEGKCGKCDYLRFCGGCRARAYEHTGRYMSEEPYCAHVPPSVRAHEG